MSEHTELYAQEDEFPFVSKLIPELIPTFLDIGAEKGSFSRLCLSCGMTGVAFEPLPDHLPGLEKMTDSGKFAVFPWAVDVEDRIARFHIAVDEHGATMDYFHSLHKLEDDRRVLHEKELEVQCRSLESLEVPKKIPTKLGILKTDTEENYLRVLQGMKHLRPQVVICEFFTEGLYSGWGDAHPNKLIDFMKSLDYSNWISFSRNADVKSTRINPQTFLPEEWGNILFIHDNAYEAIGEVCHIEQFSDSSCSALTNCISDEVLLLHKVCEERLNLINRLHDEAARLRAELLNKDDVIHKLNHKGK